MDNLTGKRFGRLLVTEFAGRGKQGKALWQCQCDCGNVVIIRAQALSAGRSGSCGCLRRDVSRNRYQTTHGMTKTAEYRVYLSAKYRCENPRDHAYRNYGARGIQFLFTSFGQFYAELGPRPPGLSLDRIENDGHYEPANVRWATRTEQNRNQRRSVRLPQSCTTQPTY
jgi:hypothetical protein